MNTNIVKISFRENFLLLIIAIICAWSNLGMASCGAWTPVTGNIDFGTMSVQRDAAVGSVIHTWVQGANLDSTPSGPCVVGATMTYMGGILVNGIVAPNGRPVYKTNLDGVGITGTINVGQVLTQITYSNPQSTNTYPNGFGSSSPSFFELIKTGPITPGTLQGGEVGRGYYDSTLAGTTTLVGGTINALACSINTPVVNVAMGDFLTTEFTTVGHTTANVNVPVTLDCDSGARINVQVVATADADATDAIKLTSGGATGVAIQLLKSDGSIAALNQKFVLSTTSSAGQYNFNWKARYIQTLQTVTTGNADASATLQLTYE